MIAVGRRSRYLNVEHDRRPTTDNDYDDDYDDDLEDRTRPRGHETPLDIETIHP